MAELRILENEKQCTWCMKILPVTDFYRDARAKSGRRPECRTCRREYMRANADKTYEAMKKWYGKNPEYQREWAKSPKAKEIIRQSRMRTYEKFKDKERARWMVKNAIRSGHLTKLPCQFCGETKSEAHHDDYAKPLDVIWVCRRCHIENFHSRKSRVQS